MPGDTARESAQVITDNFGFIDADCSASLSRDEVLQFSQDPQHSEYERNAAADFYNHFDLVGEMAHAPLPEVVATELKPFMRGDFDDTVPDHLISRKDVNALLLDYSDAAIEERADRARALEVKVATWTLAAGTVLTLGGAIGTAATMEAGPVVIAPIVVMSTGYELAHMALDDLNEGRAYEATQTHYLSKRDKVESW